MPPRLEHYHRFDNQFFDAVDAAIARANLPDDREIRSLLIDILKRYAFDDFDSAIQQFLRVNPQYRPRENS